MLAADTLLRQRHVMPPMLHMLSIRYAIVAAPICRYAAAICRCAMLTRDILLRAIFDAITIRAMLYVANRLSIENEECYIIITCYRMTAEYINCQSIDNGSCIMPLSLMPPRATVSLMLAAIRHCHAMPQRCRHAAAILPP